METLHEFQNSPGALTPLQTNFTHTMSKCVESFNNKTSQRLLKSQRWTTCKCGWWFSKISYFLLGEPLASCKFFSEMNLQFLNITGNMFTNLADFFSFVSRSARIVWTKLFQFVNLSHRFSRNRNLLEFWYETLHKLNSYLKSKAEHKNL